MVQVTGAGFAGGDGGGMEVDAPVTVRNSMVGRNNVAVAGLSGAVAFDGGIAMFGGDLTLEHTVVVANAASATGAAAPLPFGGVSSAFGGISNSGPGIPSATLTLTDSDVDANRLSGSAGVLLNGGSVFTTSGVVRTHTVIAGNKPDNCSGCWPTKRRSSESWQSYLFPAVWGGDRVRRRLGRRVAGWGDHRVQ